MSRIQDKYLAQHIAEHPFPLDGTLWARLVSIRLERVNHKPCAAGCDLLSLCHHPDNSAMAAAHQTERAGVHRWTGEMDILTTS